MFYRAYLLVVSLTRELIVVLTLITILNLAKSTKQNVFDIKMAGTFYRVHHTEHMFVSGLVSR